MEGAFGGDVEAYVFTVHALGELTLGGALKPIDALDLRWVVDDDIREAFNLLCLSHY